MKRAIFSLALLGIISVASTAQAQTLLNDTFSDSSRTDGPGLLDTDWFTTSTASSTLTAATNSLLLSGGTSNAAVIGAFANDVAQEIALGYAMELEFDFNFVTTPTSNGSGFRFGLYNSNGPRVNGDNGTLEENNSGYWAFLPTGGGTGAEFRREAGTDTTIMGGGDGTDLSIGSASTVSIAALGTNLHNAKVIFTRSGASSLLLELFFDDVLLYSVTDSSASASFMTFSEVVIGRATPTQDIRLDNIAVTYYQTPEPAGLAVLGLGALALLRRRHC